MKTQRIAEILKSGAVNTDIVVKGWVRTKRGNKNVAFIALNDGSCMANIQIVVDLTVIPEEQLKAVTTGACLRVDGKLVESPASGQGVEVQAADIEIYGTADPETYPLQKKGHSLEQNPNDEYQDTTRYPPRSFRVPSLLQKVCHSQPHAPNHL